MPLWVLFLAWLNRLRLYFSAVLEGEPYIFGGVDRCEVKQATPEPFVKLGYQALLVVEVGDEAFHRFAPRLGGRYLLGNFLEPSLGFVKADDKPFIPFLVLRLVESDVGVLIDALLLFEEVIRRFNEEMNVTDAGRHFTPRDIVRLMAELAFVPIQSKIKAKNNVYSIYDGACGTGGMLTVGEERMLLSSRKSPTHDK